MLLVHGLLRHPERDGDLGPGPSGGACVRDLQVLELLAPLALPIPAQLLTERLARRLGLDPDAPRGLRKVTQTD